MYSYIIGKITHIESNYITLDNNGIGYLISTPNPYSFHIGEEHKVYIYEHVREDEHSLYGFKEKAEKDMFLKLIEVKGVGCKMALPMLATGSIDGIIDAIERENILYLKKFPKVGDKVAKQIILDLKGKFGIVTNIKVKGSSNDELTDVLRGLGYKQNDIIRILPNVDIHKKIEDQIKEALKLLLK
jgi:holliday junction DNA helicase RuvA